MRVPATLARLVSVAGLAAIVLIRNETTSGANEFNVLQAIASLTIAQFLTLVLNKLTLRDPTLTLSLTPH